MPARFAIIAFIALAASCTRQPADQSASSDSTSASNSADLELPSYSEKLQKELPSGWTLATTPTAINVRRINPVRYYIQEPGLPQMTTDEEAAYVDLHTRSAVLEFRLRFAPQISPAESERLAAENEQLRQHAEKEYPNSKANAVNRYLTAHPEQNLHELPAFRTARHSVYLERPVRCEWLRDSTIQSQCDAVNRAIAKLFGP